MSVAFGDWNLDASTSDVTGVNAVYDFTITDTQVAALAGNFVISDGQNTLTLDATTVGALTTVAGLAAAIEADGSLTRLTASDGTGTLTLTYDDAAVVTVAPTLSENGTAGTVAETTVGVTALSSVYGTDISSIAIDTDVGANSAIAALDTAINGINAQRAVFGAGMNRLEYAIDNLTNVSQNASASRSRIEDADYAAETTELARTQIIQQAGTAMLTQANQQAQSVLALLKG